MISTLRHRRSSVHDRPTSAVEIDETDDVPSAPDMADAETPPDGSVRRWRRYLRRPTGKALGAVAAAILMLASLTASGLMLWNHSDSAHLRQQSAEFAVAARQGVVTLMSLDFNKARDDVQRIIDNSTGDFRKDFETNTNDFIQVAKDSKVVTHATVKATAVESMTDSSAVVLVAATSEVTNAAGAKDQPREWRLAVTMTRDAGQLKISKVEFVP
ncbi:hypothetical protein [Mycobacterium sp. OAE908]|uniref:hypothetical protein n=1 Tax=Mycobacterium sp. OAE908 TaxID=2817899 RepID=UPI001AE25D33